MGGGGNKKKTLGLDMCVSLFRASRSVPPRTSPEPIYRTGSESISSPSLSLSLSLSIGGRGVLRIGIAATDQ